MTKSTNSTLPQKEKYAFAFVLWGMGEKANQNENKLNKSKGTLK